MGKKQRHSAAHPDTYIHFGKPETIDLERIAYDIDTESGKYTEIRYVERFSGSSYQTGTEANTVNDTLPSVTKEGKVDGLHEKCWGRPGIAKVYRRDGRSWCRSCYTFKYSEEPHPDQLGNVHPECWGELYWRGKRGWCVKCYNIRWDIDPRLDEMREWPNTGRRILGSRKK